MRAGTDTSPRDSLRFLSSTIADEERMLVLSFRETARCGPGAICSSNTVKQDDLENCGDVTEGEEGLASIGVGYVGDAEAMFLWSM